MNWTYTDCNSSRENPRYICIFFVCFLFVVLVKLKKFFLFFSFFSIFSILFSLQLTYYSPITPQLSFSYIFMIFFQLGKKFVFLFSFFLFCFVFFFGVVSLLFFPLFFSFFFSFFSFACFSLLFPFKVL